MKVITFAVYSGGCGKSTSSSSMATILARKGYRTLFIDADKQRNSTSNMECDDKGTFTIYDVLDQHRPLQNGVKSAIRHCETCDVIAGDGMLDTLNDQLKKVNLQSPNAGTLALRRALDTIRDDYDFVVIDTSYIVDEILYAVLAATDDIIVPLDVDIKAIQGFISLNTDIKKIVSDVNPNLRVAGCLLTRVNSNMRVKNTKEFFEAAVNMAAMLNAKVFKTVIRTTEAVRTAHNHHENFILHYPRTNAAEDYEAFVDEYLADIKGDE